MMDSREAIRVWLYMSAMKDALRRIESRFFRSDEFPKDMAWREKRVEFYKWAVENWEMVSKAMRGDQGGSGSAHDRTQLGNSVDYAGGVTTAKYYRGVSFEEHESVSVTLDDVKGFIQSIVEPTMDDRQVTMLDVLADFGAERGAIQ